MHIFASFASHPFYNVYCSIRLHSLFSQHCNSIKSLLTSWFCNFLCFFFLPLYSKVPAYLNVVDIAGLVKGAAEGQGLGNAFLSHINACDAIFHLCRKFLIFLIAFQHVPSLQLIQMTLKLLSPFTPQNWRSRTCPWNSIF